MRVLAPPLGLVPLSRLNPPSGLPPPLFGTHLAYPPTQCQQQPCLDHVLAEDGGAQCMYQLAQLIAITVLGEGMSKCVWGRARASSSPPLLSSASLLQPSPLRLSPV